MYIYNPYSIQRLLSVDPSADTENPAIINPLMRGKNERDFRKGCHVCRITILIKLQLDNQYDKMIYVMPTYRGKIDSGRCQTAYRCCQTDGARVTLLSLHNVTWKEDRICKLTRTKTHASKS